MSRRHRSVAARTRLRRGAITAALLGVAGLGVMPAAGSAATRDVVVVGNAFAGTVSFLDGSTFQNLGSFNAVPDLASRKAALLLNPVSLVGWNVVKSQKGGENYIDDVALSPDGKRLYVSRGILEDVAAFDIQTKKMLWRVGVNSFNSDHMALSPDGSKLVVSATTSGRDRVINTATGALITTFAAGDYPHGVDYSADGKRVYVGSIGTTALPYALNALKGDKLLTVADATTWQVLKTFKFDYGVRPTVITGDERYAYIQRSYNRGFIEFDLNAGKTTRTATLPGTKAGDALFPDNLPANSMHHGLAFNGNETKLCNAGTIDNQISIVDRATFAVQSTVSGYAKPYWATTDRSGTKCIVSNSTGNYIAVIDYGTGREVARTPVGWYPQRERLGVLDTAAAAALSASAG